MSGDAVLVVADTLGRHPNLARFKVMLRRSARHAEDGHPYWQGSLAAYRIVAADLGYSHAEVSGWVREPAEEEHP